MISLKKQAEIRQLMEQCNVNENDLIETFILGTGKGGQKQNKTHTCVYIKHKPTGLDVKCQKDRSREINRYLARRLLCEKIMQKDDTVVSKKELSIEKIQKQKQKKKQRQKKRDQTS